MDEKRKKNVCMEKNNDLSKRIQQLVVRSSHIFSNFFKSSNPILARTTNHCLNTNSSR